MDDGLQDLQSDSLKKEIEKLRQTVGSSAADDSDATSDDEGALHVDYDLGDELSERDDAATDGGNIAVEGYICSFLLYRSTIACVLCPCVQR